MKEDTLRLFLNKKVRIFRQMPSGEVWTYKGIILSIENKKLEFFDDTKQYAFTCDTDDITDCGVVLNE